MTIYELAEKYEKLILSPEQISNLNDDDLELFDKLATEKAEHKRFCKLAYWKPYPFQRDWIRASKTYSQRYLSAANRIGKTHSACYELAAHITGLYPPDWEGAVIDDGDHDYWCIGVSQESVNNVLMKELLGVSDCRNLTNLGSGAIPKECIDVWSMVKDGQRCLKVGITHSSGKRNTLHFFASTQDETVFMGSSVKYILMDEQFKTEAEIYAQALTRTATTKGFISVTCTPEQGITPLWDKFSKDDSGFLYFQSATWDDAPHLTEEDKARLLAGYPEYQRDMRSKGIPVLGSGAVYPFSETEIKGTVTAEQIKSNPYAYKVLWGCDFGYSSNTDADPSTLVLAAYSLEEDRIYIVEEWNSKQDAKRNRLAHMPDHMASIIKSSLFPDAPLLVPHDGKRQIEGTNTTRISEFKRLGVNVLPTVFEIPFQLTTGAIEKPKHSRSLHWTIQHLCKLFSEDKLKLNVEKLPVLMSEFRIYQYKDNGDPVDRKNHLLDAMRIAAISVKYKGEYAQFTTGGQKKNRWSTGQKINKAFNRHF
ncbi:terminase large subunit domain-containing protein [Klebsiella variicola]|uniref:terminase large subunit domain-containing protein n=1 Tax=Klebsiella variicola TaxID=244366 RepID=UPI0034DECE2A